MHTYSLIHDDLPAMDNDQIRRGQPTSHIKFGEANAILSGDALQALAYEVISSDADLSNAHKVKAINNLASACGKSGMVYGQYLDVKNEGVLLDIDELIKIHRLKTGKLIESSISCEVFWYLLKSLCALSISELAYSYALLCVINVAKEDLLFFKSEFLSFPISKSPTSNRSSIIWNASP